jgi:hypothetical protein
MTDISSQQARASTSKERQAMQAGAPEDKTPIIPTWVAAGGWLYLLPASLAVVWALTHIGRAASPGLAWALFTVVLCGTLQLWWRGYRRRAEASEALKEQSRYQLHELTRIDGMTWKQFEHYCAALLEARGYRDVLVIGGPHDDGGDITATAPDGTPVAAQCKHWKSSVGLRVVRELLGTTLSGRHQGRSGIVMTNARVTPRAQRRAENDDIQVVDRRVLQEWMLDARDEAEKRGHAPQAAITMRPDGMRPAGQVLTGVLCCALTLLTLIAFPPAAPNMTAAAATPSSRRELSAPVAVVKELFTAINNRDWPTVWRLWYRPDPGYGPGYHKMISGYRLTARDVVTSLRATGDTVTANVLAYETTGTVENFNFQYKVEHGKITWGVSHLLGISHPRAIPPARGSSSP